MKKILILLIAVCLCSCGGPSYRDDDKFIVKSIKLYSGDYHYEYTLYHIAFDELYYKTILLSNEKYELNDTLRLMK